MTMDSNQSGSTPCVIVRIDRTLEDIIPIFLANRLKDLLTLRRALADTDFSTIRMLGHRLKGDGGGYGFDRISEIGNALERAAEERDALASERHIAQLEEFLVHVQVVYV